MPQFVCSSLWYNISLYQVLLLSRFVIPPLIFVPYYFFSSFFPFILINPTSTKYVAIIFLSYAFNNLRVVTYQEKEKHNMFPGYAVPFQST